MELAAYLGELFIYYNIYHYLSKQLVNNMEFVSIAPSLLARVWEQKKSTMVSCRQPDTIFGPFDAIFGPFDAIFGPGDSCIGRASELE